MKNQANSIDEYIASAPENTRATLEKLRETIRESAPDAEETISYRMPAFRQGKVLVYFAVFANHIGFFPTASGIDAFKEELESYDTSKGTVRFPLGQPIPYDLIKRIVEFRVKEVSGK